MSVKTQLSITEAAKIVGIERSTLYRHIDEKGISVIKKEGSHPKIDVSELIRVYGEQVDPSRLDTKNKTNATKHETDDGAGLDEKASGLNLLERINLLEDERKRERVQFQDQIEHLKEMLTSEQEERRKITALLTDQRQNEEKQQDDSWKRALETLEKRIANQELEAESKKQQDAKILEENKKLKRAYLQQKKAFETEKNKSFWQKLFG